MLFIRLTLVGILNDKLPKSTSWISDDDREDEMCCGLGSCHFTLSFGTCIDLSKYMDVNVSRVTMAPIQL